MEINNYTVSAAQINVLADIIYYTPIHNANACTTCIHLAVVSLNHNYK